MCIACFTAAHGVRVHFLQGHCYKAHSWNILKCSSQTSVFQQVSLRSREISLGHGKQKTDFEVFLTYLPSMSLFVFFEVESKRNGQQCDYYMRAWRKKAFHRRDTAVTQSRKSRLYRSQTQAHSPFYPAVFNDLE